MWADDGGGILVKPMNCLVRDTSEPAFIRRRVYDDGMYTAISELVIISFHYLCFRKFRDKAKHVLASSALSEGRFRGLGQS